MNKKILSLMIVGIFLLSLASVSACNANNDFILGENVTICLGEGVYKNSSGEYPLDGSEDCSLYVYYPNGTNLINDEEMTLNSSNNRWQYNLGNLSNTGEYAVYSYCSKDKGWWNDWWTFNLDKQRETLSSSYSGTVLGDEQEDIKEKEEESYKIPKDINNALEDLSEKISPQNKTLIKNILIFLIILLFFGSEIYKLIKKIKFREKW